MFLVITAERWCDFMNVPIQQRFSLKDKVIVLTGGGGFLMGTIAGVAARAGAKVVLLDISYESACDVADAITKDGLEAISLQADVCDKSSLQVACQAIISRFGKIDCLVNGAGGNIKEATTSDECEFFDITDDVWRKVLDLNFTGVLYACQIFGREIISQKAGSIVNIASIAGLRPLTRAAGYAAGKAAVINFTQWLSVHLCRCYSPEIRVNAVCPGFFATKQNYYLLYDANGRLTDRGKTILTSVPQKRFGRPEELAGAAIWLLSEASSFVTGSVITVDGGFSAFAGV
jgi:NAD(P)-dependent dehydrogenase (short-subunit alcohol dehydrogenase family)